MRVLGALREKARRALDPAALIVWRRVPVRAALMLHTDCARLGRRGEGDRPELHESLAAEIAGMLRDDEANQDFARRWYLVMAGLAAGENRWPDALEWTERGRRDFPNSTELLVAAGAIEEVHALQTGRAAHVEKAREALRAALAADPSLSEAHLRLGRVAWRLGDDAEARSALEEVFTRNHTRGEAFLAHLFLGRVHEDAGRLDEAARSYEAALTLESNSQSARLALSHVRLRGGDAATARAEAQRALRPAGARLRPDPFWLYPWGPSVGVEERLEALRREACT
jgi:tetratricopeptide (TPR) repeat protein